MENLRVAKVDNVVIERHVPPVSPSDLPQPERLTGTLHLTPHHLIFSPSPPSQGPSTPSPEIWIPYPSITALTRLPQTFAGKYPLQIRTRSFESFVLSFEKAMEGGAEDVWLSVKDCAVISSVEQLYAFFYKETNSSGWIYNPRTEFARQGVGSRTKAWRFTDINKDYAFSPTYPAKMVVPSRISDSVLSYAAKYRSKGRIPALSYLHWANHASITRSSQPMVGLKNARSSQDERLVECILTSHLFQDTAHTAEHIYGATSTNLIIDARPTANAVANVAIGAGTENMENYKMAKKAYLGIENIHVMRKSLHTIEEALRNWLKHVSTILDGSLVIIKNIHLNASNVLIHCSDGWDRTAQLSAVAQICLDPFYRTIEGFKVLIEKDWMSFGHKFLDRSGHLSSQAIFTVEDPPDEDSEEEGGASRAAQAFFASVQKQFQKSDSHAKEISPVFHQFLDCVWQIQRQFPDRFEFTEDWLLDIHRNLYACQFGTFLFNNEKQRVSLAGRTASFWDTSKPEYVNTTYNASLDNRENRDSDQGVLMYDPREVRFWYRLFRRGDDEMNGSKQVFFQAQGADMVTVAPGQVDPVEEAAGLESAVPGHSTSSQGVATGPSGSSGGAKALNGLSGRNTYRGLESTSSAFSLQTQGRHSPNPDIVSGVMGGGGGGVGGGGWGWSQLSSGALSAIQRGAKEIRTIGEGAYAQIRAEVSEYEPSRANGDSVGTGPSRNQSGINLDESRIMREANPWASPEATTGLARAADIPNTGGGIPTTGFSASTSSRPKVDRAPSSNSWNPNPWETRTGPSNASPTTGTAGQASRSFVIGDREAVADGLHRSLGELSLSDRPSMHPRDSTPSLTPSSKAQAPHAGQKASEADKALYEGSMGGDSKAWDPLGAT